MTKSWTLNILILSIMLFTDEIEWQVLFEVEFLLQLIES